MNEKDFYVRGTYGEIYCYPEFLKRVLDDLMKNDLDVVKPSTHNQQVCHPHPYVITKYNDGLKIIKRS